MIQPTTEVGMAFLISDLKHAAISVVGPFPIHPLGSQTLGLATKGSLLAKNSSIQIIIKRDAARRYFHLNVVSIQLQDLSLFLRR